MTTVASQRQILVNTGNRYVTFGSPHALPSQLAFDRLKDTEILSRVEDEAEVAHDRIIETVKVEGMSTDREYLDGMSGRRIDFVLKDENGSEYFIEVKAKERDPKRADLQQGMEFLKYFGEKGIKAEVWFFNISKLKLVIMADNGMFIDEMLPLDVWSRDSEGVFERSRVIDEVEDWSRRLEDFYAEAQKALSGFELTFDTSRTVIMSEEMMQEFAVTDRELRILDVVRKKEAVASFVPRGLWLIGAWGRIDLITKRETFAIVAIKEDENFIWKYAPTFSKRNLNIFDPAALPQLIGVS